ncbi:MAG: M23 family metallopeptidase [Gemmatimonadales bacterium]
MTRNRPAMTITIHRDGALNSASYRVPLVWYRIGVVALVSAGLLAILGVAVYAPVFRAAARVPGLQREVERLSADNERIGHLAAALDSLEASYGQLRRMVGADITPDPVRLAPTLPIAAAIVVHPAGDRPRYSQGPSLPSHWPLDQRGYVTRGQVSTDSVDGAHPGIDVAVAVGGLVRASGGGTVLQVGDDSEYGFFVLIQHPEGYQTMYGHLSRVVVRQGEAIPAGWVVGRSGNTGRSSAPHLHFEIRHNGVSVDPMPLIGEGRSP